MEEARFTMRVHPIIMQKMKHIAKHNGRSINKEIEQILKWVIDDYERTNGRIPLENTVTPVKPEVQPLDVPDTGMESLFRAK